MIKVLSTLLSIAAPLAPAAPVQTRPAPPPSVPNGTIIVRILPGVAQSEEKTPQSDEKPLLREEVLTPQDRYEYAKAKLDERFEKMFSIKKEIDQLNDTASSKWEEYNALRSIYERHLKRIIADWAFDMSDSPSNFAIK